MPRRIPVLLFTIGLVGILTGLLYSQPATAQSPVRLGEFSPVILRAVHTDTPFRGAPPPKLSTERAAGVTFQISYIPAGSSDFQGNPCTNWSPGSQDALKFAADIWAQQLSSSVPIAIQACWSNNLDSSTLGLTRPGDYIYDFANPPIASTWYPVALANALSGIDQNGSKPEIDATFSSGLNWYFGTDGNVGFYQYDFVSAALHEIAHGLSLAGSMRVGSTYCSPSPYACWGAGTSLPLIYDRFAENLAGQSLINSFGNPSLDLMNQLTSGNVYFNGPNAQAANCGNRPKLYAPNPWQNGTSYAHLDTTYDVQDGANRLMTPGLRNGEWVHAPGPIAIGIMRDLGWKSAFTSSPTPTFTGTARLYLPFLAVSPSASSCGL